MTQPCVNPDHFEIINGAIAPQPWMQLRTVATAQAGPKSVEYDSSGGGPKNELVYKLQTAWTNNTPMRQMLYGLVTNGGQQVALQARSRAYLEYRHGFEISADGEDIPMVPVSRFGGGADIGQAGILSVGTGFCVHDVRMNSTTHMFMPHITGWFPVEPGEKFNARVELWFKSENWENSMIDKGDQGTESLYRDAGTRLDLFAVPVLGEPIVRSTPTVVGSSWNIETDTTVAVNKPAGTAEGDYMVAVVGNASGNASQVTLPSGWTLLDQHDGGFGVLHVKVATKVAGPSEPSSYTFGHSGFPLSEGMAQIVTLRGVDTAVLPDVALQFTKPSLLGGKNTMLPSIVSYNKLMLAFSFVNQLVGQIYQTPPPGMTKLTDDQGDYNALSIAYQANPPIPTGLRPFKADRHVLIGDGRVSGVITVTGPVIEPT
ncbi:Uncharacterised protein [Mycobacteroides abscessus subsp. abscessus]|uniref:DUF7172 family protein n=1 Tax=Mycobacteroides abscessus TaxID=36809 RepID=UPI000929C926|nr:hypothetical protein [Mycobacteroides abscessus]SHT84866.1 Uncharacterised protein [Mycobacteroides abscessus subsp. abscessus]SKO51160.1 Uncharacterised protein [Mycobacteroides abscessus subsp. abscessus]